MRHTWKQARWRKLVRGQSGTTEAAGMIRPDRPRQIDAVIDYFGGTREARMAPAVRGRNGQVFTTDGPFVETKELGGGLAVGRAWGSPQPLSQQSRVDPDWRERC